MAATLALGAALLYALKSVLQQRAAADAPRETALRLGLLLYLARRPLWLAGIVTDVSAYGLHFLALERGSLVLVQPILVTSLLFALPLRAAVWGKRMRRREWAAGLVVVSGLALFLVAAHPKNGRSEAAGPAWLILLVSIVAVSAAVVWLTRGRDDHTRAILLAVAAGLMYGLAAALTKDAAQRLDGGIGDLFTAWQTYLIPVAVGLGLVLGQSAFQAGDLRASLPVLTAAEPLVSIVIGVVLFGETMSTSHGAPLVEAATMGAIIIGIFVMARSPLAVGEIETDVS